MRKAQSGGEIIANVREKYGGGNIGCLKTR